MKRGMVGLAVGLTVALVVVLGLRLTRSQPAPNLSSVGMAQDLSSEGLTLVGEENFDGVRDDPPNPDRFAFDIGATGWGNGEQQYYTRDERNVRLDGDGHLIIDARRDGSVFTSARVVTRGKVEFGYGLLEARIKMPAGQGIHSAFWLMGTNLADVGWPECGEIDVIEIVNSGQMYHNAIHGPQRVDPKSSWKQSNDGPFDTDLTSDFHTYQVLREPGVVKIGIDGRQVGEYRAQSAPPDARWVFDAPMYITMNVAVGGEWPGPVPDTTGFPVSMQVDSIKYWH